MLELSTVRLTMSGTATLDKRLNVAYFEAGGTVAFNIGARTSQGAAMVMGIKIFKVGTFRDSLGIQHTWTQEHLDQMVSNFDLLRAQNILPNVPWRIDHSGSAAGVVGYFQRLYPENGFLLADVNFTVPSAVDGMANGTFRSRSLEVGVYETNDEAFYWPVVTGCAFVDLPAVEGLYSAAQPKDRTVLYDGTNKGVSSMFQIDGKDVTPEEWTAAATYAQALVDAEAVPAAEHSAVVGERDQLKADLATATSAIAAHGKGQATEFRVNGQGSIDPVVVQNHITTLETFRTESVKAAKSQYVRDLAAGNKLPASQIDSQVAFVDGLTDEQFAAFKTSWDAAPENSMFAKHGNGTTNQEGTKPAGGNSQPTELETATEIVAMHRRSGMKEEQVKLTSSFVRMTELQNASK